MKLQSSWSDYTWHELREVVRKYRVVALIPIGSTEQHGPHLPLGTDYLIAEKVSELAANEFNSRHQDAVLLKLPVIPFGYSVMWSSYVGTVTLSTQTIYSLLHDILNSIVRSGIQRIIVVNAHAGNNEVLKVAARDFVERSKCIIALANVWELVGDVINQVMDTKFFHADETETSLALALGIKVKNFKFRGSKVWRTYNDFWHSMDLTVRPKVYIFKPESTITDILGAYGRPDLANKEKGEKLLRHMVERIVKLAEILLSQS